MNIKNMNSKKVKKVEIINESETKYSLNVDDNHNYFSTGNLLSKNCVIVDEAQNITVKQMKMIVTRLGKGSKLIFCGDTSQVDLKRKSDSGLGYLIEAGKNIKGFVAIELFTNHRHSIVDSFIESFDNLDSKNS